MSSKVKCGAGKWFINVVVAKEEKVWFLKVHVHMFSGLFNIILSLAQPSFALDLPFTFVFSDSSSQNTL